MSNLVQCNICQRWYSNQHGLLIHLRFCCERHGREQDDGNHLLLEHNPLKSCYNQGDHLNPVAVYDELDNSRIEHSTYEDCLKEGVWECSTNEDIVVNGNEEDNLANYGGDNTNGQCSTAFSKLQIRLNDLINCHKAIIANDI